MSGDTDSEATRLDRWLWAARVYKTRSAAADACDGGKVDVNGSAAKPHKLVRPGDLVEATLDRLRRRLRVLGIAERRGPASVARELFEDLTPPPPPREDLPNLSVRDPGAGRPTKRQRREIDRWRGR